MLRKIVLTVFLLLVFAAGLLTWSDMVLLDTTNKAVVAEEHIDPRTNIEDDYSDVVLAPMLDVDFSNNDVSSDKIALDFYVLGEEEYYLIDELPNLKGVENDSSNLHGLNKNFIGRVETVEEFDKRSFASQMKTIVPDVLYELREILLPPTPDPLPILRTVAELPVAFQSLNRLVLVSSDERIPSIDDTPPFILETHYNRQNVYVPTGEHVYLKPNYVVVVDHSGGHSNAFYRSDENRLIYTSTADRADFSNLSATIFEEWNSFYRTKLYKGYCDLLMHATYADIDYFWLPNKSAPSISELVEFNSKLLMSLDNSVNFVNENRDIIINNSVIICFDQKINGVLPFQSNFIYDAISNISLK